MSMCSADAVVFHHKGFERPTTIGSVGQIIHAGVDLGIARAAFAETVDFVKTKSRPWMDSGVDRASDDPLDHRQGRPDRHPSRGGDGCRRTRRPARSTSPRSTRAKTNVVAATLAVAAAKVLTTEIALEASNTLFELAGTSSVTRRPQSRPPLAQRPHPHAARSGALEISCGRQLPSERCDAAEERRALNLQSCQEGPLPIPERAFFVHLGRMLISCRG